MRRLMSRDVDRVATRKSRVFILRTASTGLLCTDCVQYGQPPGLSRLFYNLFVYGDGWGNVFDNGREADSKWAAIPKTLDVQQFQSARSAHCFVSAKASSHSRPKIGQGPALQGRRCNAIRIAEVDCPVVRSTVKSRQAAPACDKSLWPITSPVAASVIVTKGKPPLVNASARAANCRR